MWSTRSASGVPPQPAALARVGRAESESLACAAGLRCGLGRIRPGFPIYCKRRGKDMGEHFEALAGWLGNYGYPVLFLAVFAENVGLPVPGETTVLAASLLA